MTDNPSSSVPPSSLGARIVDRFVDRFTPARHWLLEDDQKAWLRREIDSALASQEARHRQEMEEAKRERDEAQEKLKTLRQCIYTSFRDLIPAIPVGLDPAGYRVGMAERLWKQAERSREALLYTSDKQTVAWKERALAAEQREREAGELAEGWLTMLKEVHKPHPQPEICAACVSILQRRPAALAAIRCAPSPVSAPPLKGVEGETPSVIRSDQVKPTSALTPITSGDERAPGRDVVDSSGVTPGLGVSPASPVEPGSDPQEPETR